ncbi:hypothetical protein F2Q70_00027412 [Brassica cretica]|uniref:F-box domain-containing protein n=1 Tax=Brassica cretica TaxID=69181 RepID=A0A8S9LBL0_BRACR|nr:hypothetical protein F2Q70_00027412 [Brassica cretica]
MMSKQMAKINPDMLMRSDDQTPKIGASLSQSKRRKISNVGIKPNIPDLSVKPCYDSDEEQNGEITKTFQNLACLKSHDGCYVHHKLLSELEVEIFAHLPCFEYWKLQFLNKKFLQLLKSGEIFRVRQEKGLVKHYVILHSGAESNWEIFDKDFKTFQKLPKVPSSDYCFFQSDKETISVGTQLIVTGREIEGIVVFRYELENRGIQKDDNGNPIVVRTVEKYNADTKSWTMINGMHKARKFSSGCFLRGKFYVLGGRDENDKHLTCGESYDETTNSFFYSLEEMMSKEMAKINPDMLMLSDDQTPKIRLPKVPSSDYCFFHSDKETISVGGIQMDDNGNPIVVRTVETYNADTKNENDKHLTCGESYDETTNSWELIPDMLKDMTFIIPSQSPPLIAVVDHNLYMLEKSLNELCVYDINTNIWKTLGVVPVSANTTFGWGTAFKSMGDRLLVVGTSHSWHRKAIVYSCLESSQQGDSSIASGLRGKFMSLIDGMISECGSETSRLAGEMLELQGELESDLGKTASSLLKEKKARKAKSSEVRHLQRQIEGDAEFASRGIREERDTLRSEFQARLSKTSAFLGSLECIRNRDLALVMIEGGMAVVQSFQRPDCPAAREILQSRTEISISS